MIDAERAAAVARAHARTVAAQARRLLEGHGLPVWVHGEERRFPPLWGASESELQAAVEHRWPEMDSQQQLEVVTAALELQRESVSATRHIDREKFMADRQPALHWIRDYRARYPDHSLAQGWDAICADPNARKVTEGSFGSLWYQVAPNGNGKAKPATNGKKNGKVATTRPQADGGPEPPGDLAGDSANVVTEIPTPDIGLRALPAAAEPEPDTRAPLAASGPPSAEAAGEREVIFRDEHGGSFKATRSSGGAWRVELLLEGATDELVSRLATLACRELLDMPV